MFEILHVIHITFKNCIGFSKIKHTYSISPIHCVHGFYTSCEHISTVYDQQNSLVLPNKNNIVSHKIWNNLRAITTWKWCDLTSQSGKWFKTYTLTSDDRQVKHFLQWLVVREIIYFSATKAIYKKT